jgi:hypothetical protein
MDSPVIRHAKLATVNHNWIQKVVEAPGFKKGAFTKKAKRAGRKTKAFMSEVIRHPDDFDPQTARQARFMRNILQKD